LSHTKWKKTEGDGVCEYMRRYEYLFAFIYNDTQHNTSQPSIGPEV